MSDLIDTIRAVVRDEMGRKRHPELGTVTGVHPSDGGDDPNHQVTVKLRGSGVELQRVAVAVDRLGAAVLPREGELVLVAFVDGDLNAPVVVGSLYDDQIQPPEAGPLEIVYQPPDDEDSAVRRLHIELPGGSLITLEDETLTVDWGGSSIVVARGGDVTISAGGNIKLSAEGDVEIEAKGNVKASAQASLEMKGTASATLEGAGTAKVKGPSLTLAGNTQFSPS